MADSHDTQHSTAEVPSGGEHHAQPNVIDPSGTMIVLTWVTFAISAAVLYKVAWKPILAALDKRENDLRQAIENAEKTREELDKIEGERKRIIEEADNQSRDIVDKARGSAIEAAHSIEAKAREESQILLENARREINAEKDKAMSTLRKESAELAIEISRKILKENLDETRSRKIADTLINEF